MTDDLPEVIEAENTHARQGTVSVREDVPVTPIEFTPPSDIDSQFDLNNHVFTVPVSGMYLVNGELVELDCSVAYEMMMDQPLPAAPMEKL